MNYDSLIPKFKTPEEAIKFLHIPKRRKCIKCKGKKGDSGNTLYCSGCLKARDVKIAELKKSQAFYRENPHLIPKGIFTN